jgi:hypothetical protein
VGFPSYEATKGPIVIPTGAMRSIAQWRNPALSRKDYTIAVKSLTAGEPVADDSYPVSNVELKTIRNHADLQKHCSDCFWAN